MATQRDTNFCCEVLVEWNVINCKVVRGGLLKATLLKSSVQFAGTLGEGVQKLLQSQSLDHARSLQESRKSACDCDVQAIIITNVL